MQRSHEGLDITEDHFAAVLAHMSDAPVHVNVGAAERREMLAMLRAMKSHRRPVAARKTAALSPAVGRLHLHRMTIRLRLAGSLPLAVALLACQPANDAQTATPSMPGTAWTVNDYAPAPDDGLRVLIIHDMEGLSGQSDPSSFDYGTELYPTGQEWLVADINAVVDGLFVGGATEVLIADGHGSGNPEPDVRRDLLDERATQIIRDEPFDTYFDLPESEEIDAVAVVGMHAKTGSGGFASHTFTLGIELQVNDQPITETELVGLSWGRVDVPVIFASGDDRLAADLQTMPWIEYVTVKQATAADSAIPLPTDEARSELRAGAQRAMENLANAKVMKVSTPIYASLHAVPPASLSFLEGIPGISYGDETLTFVTEDLREAYNGLVEIVGLATLAYTRILREVISDRMDASEIMSAYGDALTRRWFDQESGRLAPPAQVGQGDGGLQRFHGYR